MNEARRRSGGRKRGATDECAREAAGIKSVHVRRLLSHRRGAAAARKGASSAAERLHLRRRRKAARLRRHCKVEGAPLRTAAQAPKGVLRRWGTAEWTVGWGARLAETGLAGVVDMMLAKALARMDTSG
jgi:hypothetical protein